MTDKREQDNVQEESGEGTGPTTTPSGAGYGNDAGEHGNDDAEEPTEKGDPSPAMQPPVGNS